MPEGADFDEVKSLVQFRRVDRLAELAVAGRAWADPWAALVAKRLEPIVSVAGRAEIDCAIAVDVAAAVDFEQGVVAVGGGIADAAQQVDLHRLELDLEFRGSDHVHVGREAPWR